MNCQCGHPKFNHEVYRGQTQCHGGARPCYCFIFTPEPIHTILGLPKYTPGVVLERE